MARFSRETLAIPGVVDVQAADARVERDADGYYQLKATEKAGNPFEKVSVCVCVCIWVCFASARSLDSPDTVALQLKVARDPMKHLLHLNEVNTLAADVAARGFEAVDDGKEAEVELDHRLKWLGFFHKRKHHYGRYMMRLKLPGGFISAEQARAAQGLRCWQL